MALTTPNPLLQAWHTPHGLPPFQDVAAEHFAPAFDAALAEHLADIERIAASAQAPTFHNTIAALDRSGRLLERTAALFYNLTASETSPALQAVERDMAPRLAAHHNAVHTHAGLFWRIDELHAQRSALKLTAEEQRVLERVHFDFVRAGAKLAPAAQARYGHIVQRLAELTTRFGQNVLADEAQYRLVLRDEADLAGLPDFVRASARQAAAERGLSEAGVITLSRSHIVPFLTFSRRRDLREHAWRAWTTRGEHDGEHDNRPVAREILSLRSEQARLHGYASFADYVLADTMAKTQESVADLLQQVWVPAKARAEEEREALQAFAMAHGESTAIEAWDWRYYAEKVRQQRYDIDEALVKPYFPLPRMVQAVFDCANRLFGLRFVELPERAYHPDVKVYEVRDAQNGIVDAIATAPVNKHAWSLAGLDWKGHTELLAHLTGSTRVAMLFWSEPLKVVLATVHVPLAEVPARLTRQVLDDVITLTASELPAMGLARPRVALAGLNPHAGEDGVIGHDEENVLRPAVEAARAGGVNIEGPFPADTLFVRASRGEFDVVIACYHDQGLIPVKLLAFGRAVNVTIGLPIIRTSVDHGTAFDIAGKGVADPSSMVEAVLLAAHLARLKRDRRDGGSFRPALRT